MTEARPLSAEEIVTRLRQYSDPTTDRGIYPLLIEKPEAAAIIATIEQQAEQIKRLRAMTDKHAEKLLGDRAVLQVAIHDALAYLEEEEAGEIVSPIRAALRSALVSIALIPAATEPKP